MRARCLQGLDIDQGGLPHCATVASGLGREITLAPVRQWEAQATARHPRAESVAKHGFFG